MTVCVGVPFSNGIVLAADTQVTATNYKDYAPKLGFTGTRSFCVGMAGSGYLDLLNDTIDSLTKHLPTVGGNSIQEIHDKIRNKLTAIYRPHRKDARSQQLLTAICIPPESPRLFVWRTNIPSEEGIAVIGCGDVELTRFLKSLISAQPQTADEALHWALYVVWRAKKFVNGCGGDTGALIVTNDAKVEKVTCPRTQYLETYLETVEQEIAEFTSKVMFSAVSQTDFSLLMGGFRQRLWDAHEERFKDFSRHA